MKTISQQTKTPSHSSNDEPKSVNKEINKQSKNYTMSHINIQSISTALNGLEIFAHKNNIDFLLITEHWQTHEQLAAYKPHGYNLISSFCGEQNKHGGYVQYTFSRFFDRLHLQCQMISDIK